MALAKTARTLVSAATTVTAGGSAVYGRVDLNAVQGGGYLTLKITNGSSAPTTQCTANILIAHNATLPSAAAAGTDWKTIASYGGGTVANGVTEIGMPIDPSVMCLEVEFTAPGTNNVTVEAFFSELTSAM